MIPSGSQIGPTPIRVVLDTSVMVAAVRSRRGASHCLLRQIPSGLFQPCLSVPLYLEWQEVLSRSEHMPSGMTVEDVRDFLRYLASQCHLQEVHYLWRPSLPDPGDDMVLELAFAAGCRHIITHNTRDFVGAEQLGVSALTPAAFLDMLRGST